MELQTPPFWRPFTYPTPYSLTHLTLDKMAAFLADDNFKCIFLNGFEFHWNLFPGFKLVVGQQWFRQWLGAKQAYYLNHCLPSSLTHICGTRGRWVKWNRLLFTWNGPMFYRKWRKCRIEHLRAMCLWLSSNRAWTLNVRQERYFNLNDWKLIM